MADAAKPAIGILGGSFDPLHCAHLAIAHLACEHFGLEKVLFVPANIPPHKSRTVCAPAKHRLAMLRCAIARERRFAAWDIELRRRGRSYTIDTLRILKKKRPERQVCFIIGSDNLKEIATWHRYRAILPLVTLCVTHRPGYSMRVPAEIREARIHTFPSPQWGVSSSEIRRLLKNGYSCRGLIPPEVRQYIRMHNLYR